MIIILSKEFDDNTDQVIDWLQSREAEFLRVKSTDLLNNASSISLQVNQTSIQIGEVTINSQDEDVVWFRNFDLKEGFQLSNRSEVANWDKVKNYLTDEFSTALQGLFSSWRNKKWLCSHAASSFTKLNALQVAASVGLTIPDTLITNQKAVLSAFLAKHPKGIITKPLYEAQFIHIDHELFNLHTLVVDSAAMEEIPETFHLSKLQQRIEKKYEVRVFYLDGECYPMAIMSQTDQKTSVDYRNYNTEKPNRNVPHLLPAMINEKIINFMKAMELNTGSIDFIKSTDNEYVFLEVNPHGQFGMVSAPCNYYLEEKIADYLIDQQV